MKEKLKQWAGPFIVGAILGMILMPLVFGFVTSSTAEEMAAEAAQAATVAALTPFCVAAAQADAEKLAEVKAMSSYQQRGEVSKAGWATYPDGASASLKRAIDQGCIDGLK